MCRVRVMVCLVPLLYQDTSFTHYILRCSQPRPRKRTSSEHRTATVMKPTLGLAVRLKFKYKKSLLKIVGCMDCQESQY